MRYVYIFIYLLIYRFTVQSTIVNEVNLFTMPGMQCVVYAKSLKVLAATIVIYCLLANSRQGDSPIVSSAFR